MIKRRIGELLKKVLSIHTVMKIPLYTLLLLIFAYSCTQQPKDQSSRENVQLAKNKHPERNAAVPNQAELSEIGTPVIPVNTILANFSSFWSYYTDYIKLYEDFTAFDPKGKHISKNVFLTKLNSGLYFPLAIKSGKPDIHYRLAKIPPTADKIIAQYMRQFSKEQLVFYHLQGKPIPKFSFTDVRGNLYTSENTRGKILLFKCWYIGCTACVQEMPALNRLVEKYSDRTDILFISLASDHKNELTNFLKKKAFEYATVPDQEDYMTSKLRVTSYPTHFLINKEGILVSVLPDNYAVADALAKELSLRKSYKR